LRVVPYKKKKNIAIVSKFGGGVMMAFFICIIKGVCLGGRPMSTLASRMWAKAVNWSIYILPL
jgi:hypothetical protein